jgi:adenylate cyclase, class 2
MPEVEVKILEVDRNAIVNKLTSIGAKKVFDGPFHAVCYDTPEKSISGKRNLLRLRREGERTVMTYKRFVSNEEAKVREEVETEVVDFDEMDTLLQAMGYEPWLVMEKRRTSYKWEDVKIEIDSYGGDHSYIPVFVEIEGSSLREVAYTAQILGYERDALKSWNAVDLIEHYRPKG